MDFKDEGKNYIKFDEVTLLEIPKIVGRENEHIYSTLELRIKLLDQMFISRTTIKSDASQVNKVATIGKLLMDVGQSIELNAIHGVLWNSHKIK